LNNEDLDFNEVMEEYYELALEAGKTSDDAWLYIEGVWWPNPYYGGEPIKHPELANEND
jgi:hypothetical protein